MESGKGGYGRRGSLAAAVSALLAGVLALGALALPVPAHAEGRPDIQGVCTTYCANPGLSADSANLFDITMPDGQVIRGYCMDHGKAAPADGAYTFSGSWTGSSYRIKVHTEGADPYPGQIWTGSCQAVGDFFWSPLGSIAVQKGSFDPGLSSGNGCYSLAGATFEVKDASGAIVGSIVTGADGRGSLGSLVAGTYTVRETSAPPGFALDPSDHTVEVGSGAATIQLQDAPQYAVVDVVAAKYDSDLLFDAAGNRPQGDAALAGAEFEVRFYAGYYDTVAAAEASGAPLRMWTLRTDEQGFARLGDAWLVSGDALFRTSAGVPVLPLGTVTVQEVKAPEGYLLGDGTTPPEAACLCIRGDGGMASQVGSFQVPCVADRVVRGDVSLVKFGNPEGETGDPSLKQPLAGVSFDLVHAATGQVAARITTDDRGYATTVGSGSSPQGALPYGTYLVREDPATVPAGYAAIPEFPVMVAEDGRTYSYILEDTTGTALRVVKQDAETGRQVAAPMTFRILDSQMNVVSFTSYYPSVTVHTAFTTDATGACVLPERLNGGGTYYLQEVEAPEGYVLCEDPVPFTLPDGGAGFESPVTVVLADAPQKGRIAVTKVDATTGEAVPSALTRWEVRAKGDIVTPEGTVRATAGEVVAELTANGEGYAETGELYLGVYEIVETAAPEGYLLRTDAMTVELAYAGQQETVAVAAASVPNEPATGGVLLTKRDRATGAMLEGAVFSVVAVEDIATPEGTLRVRAGEEAAQMATSSEGTAEAHGLFPGAYEVVEVSPPPGYVCADERWPVEIVMPEAGFPCVDVELEVEDEPNKVEVAKMDAATKESLSGALITWWNRADERSEPFEGGIEVPGAGGRSAYVAAERLQQEMTDSEGMVRAERLAPGTHAFAETAAPSGYVLDRTPQEVAVDEDGTLAGKGSAVLVFENQHQDTPAASTVRTGDVATRVALALGAAASLAAAAVAFVVHRSRRA